jgi:hypothetical protein
MSNEISNQLENSEKQKNKQVYYKIIEIKHIYLKKINLLIN